MIVTRQPSGNQYLGHSGGRPKKGAPKEGTALRAAYDTLRAGQDLPKYTPAGTMPTLRDFYGMEFETKKGPNGYVRLIGEWDGPYFVPIERILQDE